MRKTAAVVAPRPMPTHWMDDSYHYEKRTSKMEIALRYKLLVNTLHTVYSVYSVFTVFISSTTNTVYILYTYCWMVWASWEGFMAWWAKQDFICFESSNRRNFATQYLSYNKKNSISIKVGKLGAKKRTVGQSIGAELLKINIIFLKLKFSSIKILKITTRAYHYQRGLLPAKSFTGTNTQKNSSAQWSRCQLGCSGSQNLPGSNYRRIICSCSYYMEHAKILI